MILNRLKQLFIVFGLLSFTANAQQAQRVPETTRKATSKTGKPFFPPVSRNTLPVNYKTDIITGAEQTELYLPKLRGKNVAVVANQTSMVTNTHLVDTLISSRVRIKLVFTPEHGFRGDADAGQHLNNSYDQKSKLRLISLYGDHKKPTKEDLRDVDIVIFDIQDVGARFYTYISTMHYVMEACAEENIPLLILDRPNPNGFYVDGPVLDIKYSSFVGMHPVPIVHGMTIAEYAQMINGEGWLAKKAKCKLEFVPVKNYTHKDLYKLPVKPSPNLPTMESVYLYPTLCLFEGTTESVGRGTDEPFTVVGAPKRKKGNHMFVPQSKPGAKKPLYVGQPCRGFSFSKEVPRLLSRPSLQLQWLHMVYESAPDSCDFFNSFFTSLAGNKTLETQIAQNVSIDKIQRSWFPELVKYKAIRKKYLLYKDF